MKKLGIITLIVSLVGIILMYRSKVKELERRLLLVEAEDDEDLEAERRRVFQWALEKRSEYMRLTPTQKAYRWRAWADDGITPLPLLQDEDGQWLYDIETEAGLNALLEAEGNLIDQESEKED